MFFCKNCCKKVNNESMEEEIPLPSTSYANKSADVKPSNINFIKVLGKGSYGKVMLAETKDTKELYAVKVLRKDKIIKDVIVELANTEKHVMILTEKNPFFTTLHTYFQTPERLYFVMEFESGGDLLFHLQRSQRFNETRAAFYAAEIVLALQFLHRNAIIYRDLKLANVLLDRNGHCKVADFGLSKLEMHDEATLTEVCGTPDYMAPELIQRLKYDKSIDWWSLGVLIYKMIAGRPPFKAGNQEDLFDLIIHADVEFSVQFSRRAISVINGLMEKSPELRIGNTTNEQQIKSHRFFSHLDWTALELRQIEAPFIPSVLSDGDTSNFDKQFLNKDAVLSPISMNVRTIDQSEFVDFPWAD